MSQVPLPATAQASVSRRRGVRSVAGVVAVACAAALAAGCGTMDDRQRDTARGAGTGAVAGAVLGRATGGDASRGAVIGGAVGAVVGHLWSRRQEERRAALVASAAPTGARVERTADDRLRVQLPLDTSFDPSGADVRPAARPLLDDLARSLDPTTRVTVVAPAAAPTATAPASLSAAHAVGRYLAARGVDTQRIAVEPAAAASAAGDRHVEVWVSEVGR